MSRLKQLEARRRVLIERCALQRVELGERLAELDPLTMLRRAGGAYAGPALRHPLAWAAATVYLGINQTHILPGGSHLLIEVIHLLLGIGAMGLAEALAGAISRWKVT